MPSKAQVGLSCSFAAEDKKLFREPLFSYVLKHSFHAAITGNDTMHIKAIILISREGPFINNSCVHKQWLTSLQDHIP